MASIKNDKESKERQEKFQAILCGLLRDDDNKYCVDCDAKGPRWASWNLGIFLCIRCAGIHRNLGVHISKVKSVTLDTWTGEQLAMVQEMGNSRARAVYEANLPDNFRRPQSDSGLESFIRAKYEQKKYIAAEWVPPKPRLQVNDERSVDTGRSQSSVKPARTVIPEDPNKDKKVRPRTVANTTPMPTRPNEVRSSGSGSASVPPPITADAHRAKVDQSQTAAVAAVKAPEIDLLGLDAPVSVSKSSDNDLFNDFLSCSMPPSSSSTSPPQSTSHSTGFATEMNSDTSLFEASAGSAQAKASTKDAIMALYGPQTMSGYGTPAGLYGPSAGAFGPSSGPNPYAGAGGGSVYMTQGGMVNMQQQSLPMQPETLAGVNQMHVECKPSPSQPGFPWHIPIGDNNHSIIDIHGIPHEPDYMMSLNTVAFATSTAAVAGPVAPFSSVNGNVHWGSYPAYSTPQSTAQTHWVSSVSPDGYLQGFQAPGYQMMTANSNDQQVIVAGGAAMTPNMMGMTQMGGGVTQQNMYSMQANPQLMGGVQANPAMYNMQQLQNQMLQMNMMNGGVAGPVYAANPSNMPAVAGTQNMFGGRIPQGAATAQGSWGGMMAPHPTAHPPVVAGNIWQ